MVRYLPHGSRRATNFRHKSKPALPLHHPRLSVDRLLDRPPKMRFHYDATLHAGSLRGEISLEDNQLRNFRGSN